MGMSSKGPSMKPARWNRLCVTLRTEIIGPLIWTSWIRSVDLVWEKRDSWFWGILEGLNCSCFYHSDHDTCLLHSVHSFKSFCASFIHSSIWRLSWWRNNKSCKIYNVVDYDDNWVSSQEAACKTVNDRKGRLRNCTYKQTVADGIWQ